MEELKPCPFCGGEAGVYYFAHYDNECTVICSNPDCRASVSARSRGSMTTAYNRARKLWNRRAERACRNVSYCGNEFECSICGANLSGGDELGYVLTVGEWYAESSIRYCPNCGARVVEEE